MKTCVHCRLDMPTAAQICPNCLENANDGGHMIWGWIAFAAVVAWLLFG